MYKFENVNNVNFPIIEKFRLNDDYLNELNEIYNNRNIFKRMFLSKNIKYIKDKQRYIGFLWFSKIHHRICRIYCVQLEEGYHSEEIYTGIFKCFDNNSLILIGENNNLKSDIMRNLDFLIDSSIIEMVKRIDYRDEYENAFDRKDISFRIFRNNKDERNRCFIQNKVFHAHNRQAIGESDIIFEKMESYYIADGCIFIQRDGEDIGYGQLVNKEHKVYIVNFGIIPEYRYNGYGLLLLYKILQIASKMGFKEVYLKCDINNINAINLYHKVGFKEIEQYYIYKK